MGRATDRIPAWVKENAIMAALALIGTAALIVMDNRHVLAGDAAANQKIILDQLAIISNKFETNAKRAAWEIKVEGIRDDLSRARDGVLELEDYIQYAPTSSLTAARQQRIKRLQKEIKTLEEALEVALTEKPVDAE